MDRTGDEIVYSSHLQLCWVNIQVVLGIKKLNFCHKSENRLQMISIKLKRVLPNHTLMTSKT